MIIFYYYGKHGTCFCYYQLLPKYFSKNVTKVAPKVKNQISKEPEPNLTGSIPTHKQTFSNKK